MSSWGPLQIGGTEWIWVIIAVVIILFGAKKIPDVARSLGRARGEFERGRHEFDQELRKATSAPSTGSPDAGATERSNLERVARSLGIDPSGKSDAELREAIDERLKPT